MGPRDPPVPDDPPPLMDYVPMGFNGPPPPPPGQQPCRKCGGSGWVSRWRWVLWVIPVRERIRCGRCIGVLEQYRGLWLDPEQEQNRPVSPPPPQGSRDRREYERLLSQIRVSTALPVVLAEHNALVLRNIQRVSEMEYLFDRCKR